MGETILSIGAGLKLLLLIISWLFDKDRARKKKKLEILKELEDAIQNKDSSSIVASFDKLNRL